MLKTERSKLDTNMLHMIINSYLETLMTRNAAMSNNIPYHKHQEWDAIDITTLNSKELKMVICR